MGFRSRARAANALAPFHAVAAFGAGSVLGAIAYVQAVLLGWQDTAQLLRLAAIYAAAAVVGTAFGSWAAAWLRLRGARAFAAWAFLVGAAVMTLGALIFALLYRSAYSQWHADAFTPGWAVQGIFTMAGAAYFWAVLGTRMILPWAIVPLVLGALAFARRVR